MRENRKKLQEGDTAIIETYSYGSGRKGHLKEVEITKVGRSVIYTTDGRYEVDTGLEKVKFGQARFLWSSEEERLEFQEYKKLMDEARRYFPEYFTRHSERPMSLDVLKRVVEILRS